MRLVGEGNPKTLFEQLYNRLPSYSVDPNSKWKRHSEKRSDEESPLTSGYNETLRFAQGDKIGSTDTHR
jgi:hypothetical protein